MRKVSIVTVVSVAAILASSPVASAVVPAGDGSTNVVAPGDGSCGGGVSAFYTVTRRSNPQPGIYYAEYTVKILNCTNGTVRRAIDVNNAKDSACFSIPAGYVKTYYGAETDPGNLGEYRGIYAC